MVASGIRVATTEGLVFLGRAAAPASGATLPAATVSTSGSSARRVVGRVAARATGPGGVLVVGARPVLVIIDSTSGSLAFWLLIVSFSALLVETLAANANHADDDQHDRENHDENGDDGLAVQRLVRLVVYTDAVLEFAGERDWVVVLEQAEKGLFVVSDLVLIFVIVIVVVDRAEPALALGVAIAVVALCFAALADVQRATVSEGAAAESAVGVLLAGSGARVELAALLLVSAAASAEALVVVLAEVIDEFGALVAGRPGNAFASATTPARLLAILIYTARLSYVA